MRALSSLVALPDTALHSHVNGQPLQVQLYAALRREQRAAVATLRGAETEPNAILSFARSACNELCALLDGRNVLDVARDGEWSMRDLLRHAIAVELRYRSQVVWSAQRRDDELGIPSDRLPCDRLSPPEPEFIETRTADATTALEHLRRARAGTDEELAYLDANTLARPSVWGSLEVDVRERIHQIGVHLVEVTVQCEKMLGTTESEARRIARRIAATRGLHERESGDSVTTRLDSQLEALTRALAPAS